MKLLFTVNTYMPKRDGVQFVTKYLAEGLVRKGHSVDLITRQCKELTDINDELINGVHVIRWNANTYHTIHRGDKKGYQKFILENASNYDCMIAVGTQTSFVDWMLPIIDQVNCCKILYLHSIWDFKYHKSDFDNLSNLAKKIWANIRWKIYYNKWGKAFKKFDDVVQLHLFDYAYTYFRNKYDIESVVIENAVDNSFFDETIDPSIELPNKYFLNVSNYMDRKNQMQTLKSFLDAKISNDFELILIGSEKNSYFDSLIEYYNQYKISNTKNKKVHFLYNVPRQNIYTYVKKAYGYIMTSKWEAYPISLIEAMASGIPWISTNVGIVKYLPGGFVADEISDISYWIEFISKNGKLSKSLGNVGKVYASTQFRIDKKVDKLEDVIKKAIEKEK